MEKSHKFKISVCIPVYGMKRGYYFLDCALTSLRHQEFKDFEVVISDNSGGEFDNLIKAFGDLDINHIKTPKRGGCAANTNDAIKQAKGEIIKILHMDDSFANPRALANIAENFKKGWMACGCLHDDGKSIDKPHVPYYNDEIHTGRNTIGAPSVICFENNEPLLFNEDLVWLFDCEYYKRLYKRYGNPLLFFGLDVIIGIHESQATNLIADERKLKEHEIMNQYV